MGKLYRVVSNESVLDEDKMSVNDFGIKIGDKVEVLHYEEYKHDAPSRYIGCRGVVFSTTRINSGESRNFGVSFGEGGHFDKWDFSPEQLKLVKTN